MHRFAARLDAATAQGLQALARRHEASLHAVWLALLKLEARRRSGRADVVVGTAASFRESAAEARVVGYYVNMLPVACHLPRHVAFAAALRETQQALAAGLQHGRYPFARMYRDFWNQHPAAASPGALSAVRSSPSPRIRRSPAAPAAFRLVRPSTLAVDNADSLAYELTDASPGLDMVLIHENLADGGLLLLWQANAALYTKQTASYWFESLRDWAVWLAEDLDRAQHNMPSLLPREAALLEAWEQGAHVARPPLRFHELFERVIDNRSTEQGDRPAVITQTGATTYAAIEREANAIAHDLLRRGSAPGSVVGVLTGRSANLPAAVLGIWKAGATYLPLASGLPPERLLLMARDAGVSLLIALDGVAVPPALVRDLPPPLRPDEMDAEFRRTHAHRPPPATGADAAYIIYTSGSTGRPKGTRIGHAAYVNMVLGAGETLGLTRDDRSLMFSSPSFDVSLSDMGLPLAFGAALCPVPYEVLSSPNRFRSFLTELNVTVADITPTYLRLFDGARLPSLRILVTGGEAPFAADVETYAGRHEYFNAYGPTENTITSTMGKLRPGDQGILPCGRPLPNTSVAYLRRGGEPGPARRDGRIVAGRRGPGARLRGTAGSDRRRFVETARRAALPHGRSGPLARHGRDRNPRPHRRSGEAQRHSRRVGRNRMRAGEPSRYRASGGAARWRSGSEPQPVGFRPPVARLSSPGRRELARLSGRPPARLHDSVRGDRHPGDSAVQFRQGGQGRLESARGRPRAAWRRGDARGRPGNGDRPRVERTAGSRFHSSRRQLLLARRPQPAGYRRGVPAGKALGHPVPARELFAEPTLARLRSPGQSIGKRAGSD
jgi:non-ribosomal peptide synthetase component F